MYTLKVGRVNGLVDSTILDSVSEIEKLDSQHMLNFSIQADTHYRRAYELAKGIAMNYPKPQSIIIAGMGGNQKGSGQNDRIRISCPESFSGETGRSNYSTSSGTGKKG